jgi:hypothetical protein
VTIANVRERLQKLGLACDDVATDALQSATASLMCFPMYMVSNVHGWTGDRQFLLPVIKAHGLEAFREAIAIGREKSSLDIEEAHERVLDGMLASGRPSDLVVYEYALETLRLFLDHASPELATTVRTRVADMVVNVASAAGKKLFGAEDKVSPEERSCIEQISNALQLRKAPAAEVRLRAIGLG